MQSVEESQYDKINNAGTMSLILTMPMKMEKQ
jgi:hypothetical protein